jgi:hypothetical protein
MPRRGPFPSEQALLLDFLSLKAEVPDRLAPAKRGPAVKVRSLFPDFRKTRQDREPSFQAFLKKARS